MKSLAPIAVALALGLAATGSAYAQACLDKREIQDAVSSGQIMSLDAVLASAGVDGNADILSVQVCDEGGRLVYVIGVLSPDGDAQNLVLSAQ
ncbi:PepSY domain-containing protein [Devosia sp. A369]